MEQQTQMKDKTGVVNGVNVDELFGTINAVKAAPVIATFKFRRMVHREHESIDGC